MWKDGAFWPNLHNKSKRYVNTKIHRYNKKVSIYTCIWSTMLPRDHAIRFKERDRGLASSPALPSLLLQIPHLPLNNVTFIRQKKVKCNFLKGAKASLFLLLPESIIFNVNKKPLDKPSILLCLSMWITPEFSISTTVFMCLRINSSSTTCVKQTYLQHCTTFLTKLLKLSHDR